MKSHEQHKFGRCYKTFKESLMIGVTGNSKNFLAAQKGWRYQKTDWGVDT